jgi:twitching motility protein PilT
MYSAIQTGQQFGMQTLDQKLQQFLKEGAITREAAREKAVFKDKFS